MRSTDRDSEWVAASACSEVDNFLWLSVVRLSSYYLVFYASEYAELSLYSYVKLVSVIYYLLSEGNIFLVWEWRTVDHDRREAIVDTVLTEFECISVVEVEYDFRMLASELLSVFYSTLSKVTEDSAVSIVTSTLWNLHDNRRLSFYCSHNDSLHLLHCVEVECWNSVTASNCALEHLAGVYETEVFVIYHNSKLYLKCNTYYYPNCFI